METIHRLVVVVFQVCVFMILGTRFSTLTTRVEPMGHIPGRSKRKGKKKKRRTNTREEFIYMGTDLIKVSNFIVLQ